MTAYRPTDSKREEFRKYIERSGLLDALTRILVSLYEDPDKPEDALEFLRKQLGESKPSTVELDSIRSDLEKAMKRIEELELENKELKMKIYGEESAENGPEAGSGEFNEPLKKPLQSDEMKTIDRTQ